MRTDPYWWEATPLPILQRAPLPASADVVVIGAGYTGLSAAIALARAGRAVVVVDKLRAGEGASTRNGGITSGNLRPSLAQLTKKFGAERAHRVLAESKVAREDLYRFIADEKIDCDFALTGRFCGAGSPSDYERLARDADYLNRTFGIEAYATLREKQRDILGTDYYYGGSVRMDIGGLHPAKLHAGMFKLALGAGAAVHDRTAVIGIRQDAGGFDVTTSAGTIRARDVIVGTNGYTDASDPWLRRRLVPLRSRIIATAPLSPNLMNTLTPRRMMATDTRKLSYYYRPSPDGKRILFGGRDGPTAADSSKPTEQLQQVLVGIFPELADVEITHSWFGYVAMHRDMIPRIFTRHGRRYATGYCGSGVVWARWAGQKAAFQILKQDDPSALDFRPPPAVPLYSGAPWFIPAYLTWLSFQDKLARMTRR